MGKLEAALPVAQASRFSDSAPGPSCRSILTGSETLLSRLDLRRLTRDVPVALFGELHKYRRWKQFLKGCFDENAERVRVLVTGSSRMDVFQRGGDSLTGRYFRYRMHPFSVAEIATQALPDPKQVIRPPRRISRPIFKPCGSTWGYPEPFLARDPRFSRRWQNLRQRQLVREEIRELSQIQQLDQLAALVTILSARSAQQLVFGNLATEIRVSIDTARRWVEILRDFHLGFLVRPCHKNVSRSLRKEPKWFLRDWADVAGAGVWAETFVACHLLKAVEGWTDFGLGVFELGYIRDKEKREVDFIVTRDGNPWFLVEVKPSNTSLSPALHHHQKQLRAPHAFQVAVDADYVQADCFARTGGPVVVPARTLLSQLL